MTEDERAILRAEIGTAVLKVQSQYRGRRTPEEIIPEIIAALISFAAFIARENANLSHEHFLGVCLEAAKDEWGTYQFREVKPDAQ